MKTELIYIVIDENTNKAKFQLKSLLDQSQTQNTKENDDIFEIKEEFKEEDLSKIKASKTMKTSKTAVSCENKRFEDLPDYKILQKYQIEEELEVYINIYIYIYIYI